MPADSAPKASEKTEEKPNDSDRHLSCMAIPIGYMFVKRIATKYIKEGRFDHGPELESIRSMFGEGVMIGNSSKDYFTMHGIFIIYIYRSYKS